MCLNALKVLYTQSFSPNDSNHIYDTPNNGFWNDRCLNFYSLFGFRRQVKKPLGNPNLTKGYLLGSSIRFK